MNSETIPILGAILIQSALAVAVFFANPRHKPNQSFLLLSLAAIGWLGCLYFGSITTNLSILAWCIREAFAAGILILAVFNLLRLSIRERQKNWRDILRQSRGWTVLTIGMIGFCQTKFFLIGAQMEASAPKPIYGIGVYVYALYFATAIVALIIISVRDLRAASGRQRAELGFILLGAILILAFTLAAYQVLRFFIEPSRLLWLAPFRVVLFTVVVAYGLATRRIMEVGVLFRRLISYGLLSAYLLALYVLVWWLVATALRSSASNAHTIAHVAAAIVVAFAMAPARGISQEYPMVDIGLRQRLELTSDQATIVQLESNREPIVMDELHRARPTPQLRRVMRQLDSLQIALAMGIFARDQLAGVLLLGPRRSGRIYGAVEQSALQVLCGQLAVAIENAELFTEVQNAKIYNETLLENLTSGVIAAGTDERVTV